MLSSHFGAANVLCVMDTSGQRAIWRRQHEAHARPFGVFRAGDFLYIKTPSIGLATPYWALTP